jgi:putative NADPH-quinone reductase
MNASLVIGHPDKNSFSHAMAQAASEVLLDMGYALATHDLYAESFNPVQPTGESRNVRSDDALIELHCRELALADLILVFHPNWWSQPPAIVKGWIDRVFRLGTAYKYPDGASYADVPTGLLRAKAALIFNTSNTPALREIKIFGDPLEELWRTSVFALCGVDNVHRRMFTPMASSSPQQRSTWLEAVRTLVRLEA